MNLLEPASAGVTIDVLSNAVVVRTIDIAGDTDGAFTGLNTVTWDGKDAGGNNVAPGAHYSVRITAASTGYDVWTTTSTDGLDGNYVWEGRGIGVNQNPKSTYYGRIFVANSHIDDVFGINVPGDNVGMIKLNADGSFADEGAFSTGGHAWADDYYIDDDSGVWRTVSPPGTNSSTTEAVVTLEVVDLTPAPAITSCAIAAGVFTMSFTGGASDTPSAFEVLSCGTVDGSYVLASGANITESGGTFQATVPASGPVQFYRIHRK